VAATTTITVCEEEATRVISARCESDGISQTPKAAKIKLSVITAGTLAPKPWKRARSSSWTSPTRAPARLPTGRVGVARPYGSPTSPAYPRRTAVGTGSNIVGRRAGPTRSIGGLDRMTGDMQGTNDAWRTEGSISTNRKDLNSPQMPMTKGSRYTT
jgi:hypothetical protein